MRMRFALAMLMLVPAAASAQSWGNVKGRLVFGGEKLPVINKLNVNKDEGPCLKDGPLFAEDWVINKDNKGVRWCFAWLAPEDPTTKLSIHPSLATPRNKEVEVDQPCCQFVPHCLAMREGQVLVAKNPATIAHNFHWQGHPLKNAGGNVIMPAGQNYKVEVLKADRFPVKISCDIHPWMSGFVRVFDHPYFAVTDANGAFEIKNAPTGKLRLWLWQESVGYVPPAEAGSKYAGIPITIEAGKTIDVGDVKVEPK